MINTVRLRCMLGWLGILLPWIVVLLYLEFPGSISETYYKAKTITPFMVILGSSAFLLMSYKGYDKIDDIVNTLSGVCALGICAFPCYTYTMAGLNVGTFGVPIDISETIHVISAILFFTLLSINSLFLFTKTGEKRVFDGNILHYIKNLFKTPTTAGENKKKRNIIFRVCGIGMISSFLIMLLPYFRIQTWLVEAIALFFFGISFLTKANRYKFLFCD